MKQGFRIIVAICLCLTSFRSIAMAVNYVGVSCGQKHVIIKSGYAEEPPSEDASFFLQNYGQSNECRLKSGDIVRVRFGTEFDYHESQNSWVSVWFDRMKWLSRTSVEVTGPDDIRADTIDISASGVKLCWLHGPLLDALDDTDKKQTPLCKLIPKSKLSSVVDAMEPEHLDASDNPLASPTILLGLLGRDNALCRKMAALNEATLQFGVELGGHLWLNFPTGESIQLAGPTLPGTEWFVRDIDLDNSGAERHVYFRDQSMGYWENYDIFVILNDSGYRRFLHTAMTDRDLMENAESVWPMDWSGHPNRLEISKKMEDLKVSLYISDNLHEKIDIQDNQLNIIPFAYSGQTYLLLSNNQLGSDPLGFVVKPHPTGKFDQECVFKAGVTNF